MIRLVIVAAYYTVYTALWAAFLWVYGWQPERGPFAAELFAWYLAIPFIVFTWFSVMGLLVAPALAGDGNKYKGTAK